MDQTRFDNAIRLQDTGQIEEAAREFRLMAEDAADVDEKADMLINEVRCYSALWRLADAERTLRQIRDLAPPGIVTRANVDFGEACFAVQNGEKEKALDGFESTAGIR